MPAVKFPSEPPPTAASSSFHSICFAMRLRFFVERGDAGGAFHGQAVDAAVDGELAVFVEGLQGAELFVETRGLLGFFDADVDFDAWLRRRLRWCGFRRG